MTEKENKFDSLLINDTEYNTTLTKKFLDRKKWVKPNNLLIHSKLPGSIKSINVVEGQTVKKGDNLYILEAMKMLNRINAEFDCKIKKIYIKENVNISKGELILELE